MPRRTGRLTKLAPQPAPADHTCPFGNLGLEVSPRDFELRERFLAPILGCDDMLTKSLSRSGGLIPGRCLPVIDGLAKRNLPLVDSLADRSQPLFKGRPCVLEEFAERDVERTSLETARQTHLLQ